MTNKNRLAKHIAAIALLTAAAQLPALAYSPAGYPGATWGNASRNFDGLEGAGTQGWIRQGVTWFKVRGIDLNTYATYSWRLRTKNRTYYDVYGPGLLTALEKGPFNLGVEYAWLRYPKMPENARSAALFATWYYSMDLRGPDAWPGLPFTTWGRLNYDLHGEEGTGAQGWIRQGANLLRLGRGWKGGPYAAYNWRLRTKERTYYNALGPSLGLECSAKDVSLGLEYLWQRFPQLHTTTETLNLYLTWFYGWDLKGK